jgi:hypothetical protein
MIKSANTSKSSSMVYIKQIQLRRNILRAYQRLV